MASLQRRPKLCLALFLLRSWCLAEAGVRQGRRAQLRATSALNLLALSCSAPADMPGAAPQNQPLFRSVLYHLGKKRRACVCLPSQAKKRVQRDQSSHGIAFHSTKVRGKQKKNQSRAERAQVFEMEGWRAGASAGLLVVAGGLILVQGGARQQPEQLS